MFFSDQSEHPMRLRGRGRRSHRRSSASTHGPPRPRSRPGRPPLVVLALTLLAPVLSAPAAAHRPPSNSPSTGASKGRRALFLLSLDKGYFRTDGLDRHHRRGRPTPLEPITRVASGSYDMGFADINALIRYRDQNPTAPVKAVFMVYNRPPFAIVDAQEPRHHRRRSNSKARGSARRRRARPSCNGRCSPS